ncbi:MAG: nucleotide exchange factor GrpE [Proteobacteria bacterium]|nr:MAG: nucleotide exchange factor GrpE [Pseudomonadota bacterium]
MPEDKQPQADASGSPPQAGEETATASAEQPSAAPEGAGQPQPETPNFEARIAELEAQIADLTDRLLRAHAEMDNIRKRAEREKADITKYAITKFAGDVAVLSDNFQRALSAVPQHAIEQDSTLKALVEGVSMMEREFLNVLERHGVKRIDPLGQPFNPHFHDAVMEQQNPEVPNGTIVQVFQPGYMIEDRVIRPAMVVVAKGGPKATPAGKPAEQQAEPAAEQPPEQQKSQATNGNDSAEPNNGTA